jgi:hypothetical protein
MNRGTYLPGCGSERQVSGELREILSRDSAIAVAGRRRFVRTADAAY